MVEVVVVEEEGGQQAVVEVEEAGEEEVEVFRPLMELLVDEYTYPWIGFLSKVGGKLFLEHVS